MRQNEDRETETEREKAPDGRLDKVPDGRQDKVLNGGRNKAPGRISEAMCFIILFGIVSLFSDMTHEGASSIRGAFLSLLGASAGTIGFISGLGELVGYSMRYVFGRLADRTKQYWPMVLLGYTLDILAVPALALVGEHGWIAACGLLLVQRMGKALKKPAKDTIMSFAASQEGAGKSFALQEVLDQIGAFLGPLFLFLVMGARAGESTFSAYSRCFAFLAVPGAITLLLLILTRKRFPDPGRFEPEPKVYVPFRIGKSFRLYIAGISCFAFGFIDYSLIVMHISRVIAAGAGGASAAGAAAGAAAGTAAGTTVGLLLTERTLPLVYAGAMLVDAAAALFFGLLYDRRGLSVLVAATAVSAPFALCIFGPFGTAGILAGTALWGIGMGAQESILKAAVTSMVPKQSRATGYGIFELFFGIFWFLGSWALGLLYDRSVPLMIAVSAAAELAAILLYLASARTEKESAGGAVS